MAQCDYIGEAVALIRAYRREAGISGRELGRLAGLDHTSLLGMDRDAWNPTARTLRALLGAIPADFRPRQPKAG